MRVILHFITGIVILATVSGAAPEVTLDWSVKECLPGDVVTLRVRMTNGNVGGFDLKLPEDDSIEWVAHERGPLIYQPGVYTQEDTLVGQPTRPGTISLPGLHAVVRDGDKSSDETLSAPSLVVRSFGDVADDFTPEQLPAIGVEPGRKGGWGFWIAAGVLILVSLAFMLRRKPREAVVESKLLPALDELGEILENGELPEDRFERFVAERSGELPPGLREALEAAVYGRRMNRQELRLMWEGEVRR